MGPDRTDDSCDSEPVAAIFGMPPPGLVWATPIFPMIIAFGFIAKFAQAPKGHNKSK
jgi:hypothetical protein